MSGTLELPPPNAPKADEAVLGAATRVDVQPLLTAYMGAMVLSHRPPPSVTLPNVRWLRWLHLHLRPTWGARRCTARYVRRSVDALERDFAGRLATGRSDPNDQEDIAALRQFKDFLPRPTSRFVLLAAGIVAVLLAQTGIDRLPHLYRSTVFENAKHLSKALGKLKSTPDVSSIGDLLNALVHADSGQLLVFITAVSWSLYLVARPLACGYRMSQLVFGRPDSRTRLRRRSELSRASASLDITRREAEVFTPLGEDRPPAFPYDLATKALLWAGPLFLGAYALHYKLLVPGDPGAIPTAATALTPAALRLVWLGRASHRRGTGVAWMLAFVATFLAAGVVVSRPKDPQHKTVAPSPALLATVRVEHDLSGADLADLNLRGLYLRARILRGTVLGGSDLSDVDLTGADLTGAILTGANLTDAWLNSARLRRADLEGADLTGAVLDGADLRKVKNLSYARLTDAIYDKDTEWPPRFNPGKAGAIPDIDDFDSGP